MNRVKTFLAQSLGQAVSMNLMGGSFMVRNNQKYEVSDDRSSQSRDLMPGFFNITRQALLVVKSSELYDKGIIKEGDIVAYKDKNWLVARIDSGEIAWDITLVNPKARNTNA